MAAQLLVVGDNDLSTGSATGRRSEGLGRALDAPCQGRLPLARPLRSASTSCSISSRSTVATSTRSRPRRLAWYRARRSEEHTTELQSLMRISYAVFCLKKKKYQTKTYNSNN